jgi:hypothetical protein
MNTTISGFRAASRMPRMPNRNKTGTKLKCHLCLADKVTKPDWPAVDSLELLRALCGFCSCEGHPRELIRWAPRVRSGESAGKGTRSSLLVLRRPVPHIVCIVRYPALGVGTDSRMRCSVARIGEWTAVAC